MAGLVPSDGCKDTLIRNSHLVSGGFGSNLWYSL